jgi:hypothetical protein
MAKILSDAVNEALTICMERGIPAFPRTDELVCRKRDSEAVRFILAECFIKHSKVNALIGGVQLPIVIPPISDLVLSLTIKESPADTGDSKEWFSHCVDFHNLKPLVEEKP